MRSPSWSHLAVPLVLWLATPADGAELSRFDLLTSSAGAEGGALAGLANPAVWGVPGTNELAFWWDDTSLVEDTLDRWGLVHGGALSFAVERIPVIDGSDHEFHLGTAFGTSAGSFGLAWRWGGEQGLVLGSLSRPSRWVSVGWSSFFSSRDSARRGLAEVAVRPFGSPLASLAVDYEVDRSDRWNEGDWTAAVSLRPIAGFTVGARVRERLDEIETQIHAGVTIDGFGFRSSSYLDEEGERLRTTYVTRFGLGEEGLPVRDLFSETDRVRRLNLSGKTITYRRDRWFDDRRIAWIDLARELERLRDDSTVSGIAIQLSGTRIRPSVLFELREELARWRARDKEVLVHFDRLRMSGYYVASVASHVSMDPLGLLQLTGIALQRTYLAGLLEKIGIGFEEHRYFEYKSAAESYARTDMSEADREQLGRVVDVIYEHYRDAIVESRDLMPSEVDEIVDLRGMLTPQEALEEGLIDSIGRWHDLEEQVTQAGHSFAGAETRRALPHERWGKRPRIAVVYAIGPCEMESGIRGRATGEYLRRLAKRRDVVGVVVRADSPGGLPLPSDLVAEGIQKVREAGKPVVVSQGDVAASGGYWFSAPANEILTTPLTLTGSIGVISGWAWDDGIGEKTGLSADGVQRGAHADLFAGLRIPIVGARLPLRNLDDAEHERARDITMQLYDGFVGHVASHRDLSQERVREIGEGRVWMGEDAIANGLCDRVGTLTDAIERVAELSGIEKSDAEIVEFPKRRLFEWPQIGPSWLRDLARAGHERAEGDGASGSGAFLVNYVRSFADNPGAPLLWTPREALPDEWRGWR